MDRFILILVLAGISSLSFGQKNKVSIFDLDQINGLFYQRNTIPPFTGTATEEHPNGKKKMSVPIKDGMFQGTIKEWALDGTLIYESEYDKGKQQGKETQWYATGQKKIELSYVQGEPNGICTEWHKNGKKKSEGNFVMGKEDGKHLWWFTNGELDQEVPYKNGETDGLVKNWYENGTLKLESYYKLGSKDGTTTKWYENGQKKSVEFFKDDKPDGESTFWTSKGIVHTIRIHEDGRLVQEKNYRSGNINIGDGYVQVYNEIESFFKVPITGAKVRPVDLKNITYVIDDHLLQLFNIPTRLFIDTINVFEKNKPFLEAYVNYEKLVLKEREPTFDFDIKTDFFKTNNNLEAVHWYFESPSKFVEGQTDRTVQEEHYVSVLCNKQVLSIYSAVTKSDDPKAIETMLLKIANEVALEAEHIDLNEIIANLED
jgi:antitoxin component YwqK of YwqJK toxin-antitoxin module